MRLLALALLPLLAPSPGAAGAGDRLFPGLGNGGYDVSHYTLDLVYRSTAPAQRVRARVTVEARATHALSRLDLDYAGGAVRSVAVDGRRAAFRRRRQELVVTPRRPIPGGARFVVRVAYTSGPAHSGVWFTTPSGSATAAQPDGAHRIFPCDDVPSDPATYTIRADTPAASTFVANGELTAQATTGDRTQWTYEEREPMAAELIQLAFGALTVRDRGTERGVHLRDVVPTRRAAALEPVLAREVAHLDYLIDKLGPYPFTTYGTFVTDRSLGFALEDQTLSLFSARLFTPVHDTPVGDPRFYEPIMVHELAHQWLGDARPPRRWSDVWLSEGHATWYEWEYARERGDARSYLGATFPGRMRKTYAQGDRWRRRWGPVARPRSGAGLFNPNVYDGGALVLYALRQRVGDPAFREIERRWAGERAGTPASTARFIRLASAVAHRDLTGFLSRWLYGRRTPSMPGHRDWTQPGR